MEIVDLIIPFLPILATLIVSGTGLWITDKYQKFNREIANDKLNKELFTEFNARYDKLNDSLTIIESLYKDYDSFKLLEIQHKELYKKLKQDVIDFFNLCSEEYYWHKKERIDPKIWSAWHFGMNYWYNHVPTIKTLWEIEVKTAGTSSYYLNGKEGFFIEGTSKS